MLSRFGTDRAGGVLWNLFWKDVGTEATWHLHPPDWTKERTRITYRRNAHEHCDAGCAHRTASLHRFRLEPSSRRRTVHRLLRRDTGRCDLPAVRSVYEG